MALADDFDALTEAEEPPPSFTPTVEFDGTRGFVQTGPMKVGVDVPDVIRGILTDIGYDPDTMHIGRTLKASHWQQRARVRTWSEELERYVTSSEFETVWLHAIKVEIEPSVFPVDLPALYATVERTRQSKQFNPKVGDSTVVVCWADIQTGKALADDTPMLTTDGWKTHGEISPGDYVFGPDGRPKRVLGVTGSTAQELYRVEFDRGVTVTATKDHLWRGYRKYRKGTHYETRELLWTTEQIAKLPRRKNVNGTLHTPRSFQIDLTDALEMPEADLPIDPYLLGVWLGDGNSCGAHITVGREDEEWVRTFGPEVPSNCSDTKVGVHVPGLRTKLRETGLLRNKHIPEEYLTASPKQRLALLQGLMDTDGSCDARGSAEFSNTNTNIADGVCFLLASLGFKYTRKERIGKLNGQEHQCFARITTPTRADVPLFTLRRKSELENAAHPQSTRRRQVQSVVPAGIGSAQCLQVQGGMYLAGRELVVTHNCDHLGGLTELLERLDQKRENLERYLQRAQFDHIVIADCGDIIEGFQNFDAQTRTNALSIMDQVDVAATELWKLIELCAARAHVDLLSIPSNHCRWAKGKSLIGKTTDDWGLHVNKRLERHNADVGLPVQFHRTEEWMETLEFDIRNSRLGLAHGHQANNPDQIKNWWAKMTHAGVLSCDILVTGHFHFPSLRPSGKTAAGHSKWHVQASTLDNGSSWVRNKYGEDGDPALTVFQVNDEGFDVGGFALL